VTLGNLIGSVVFVGTAAGLVIGNIVLKVLDLREQHRIRVWSRPR